MTVQIWLIVGVAALVGLSMIDFVMGVAVALAAISASLVHYLVPDWRVSMGAFILVSVVTMSWGRRYRNQGPNMPDDDVGQIVEVISVLSPSELRVRYRGSEWSAILEESFGLELPKVGAHVRIAGKRGAFLIIKGE